MICGSGSVPQETKDETHRLIIEGRIPEATGVAGRGHCKAPEARYLGVWHRDATANARRKNCFSFEEARYHLVARLNDPGPFEELAESPKKFHPLAHSGRDQNHCGIKLL